VDPIFRLTAFALQVQHAGQVWELLRDVLLSGATEEVGRDAEEDEVVDLCRILLHLTTTHGPQAVLAVSGFLGEISHFTLLLLSARGPEYTRRLSDSSDGRGVN
jgi:hypothetical protein